jgi:hypothetical protein
MRFLVSFQSILKCAMLLLPPLVNRHEVVRFNLAANVSSANLFHLGAWRNPFDSVICGGGSNMLHAPLDFGRTNHRLRLCEIQEFCTKPNPLKSGPFPRADYTCKMAA